MRGLLEYEPADLTVAVAAGTPLTALRAALHPHRQRWPVEAPASEAATVGGSIAAGRAGPTRLVDGTPRDHVLGVDIVTGDGRALTFGGRVVKNVAGYDLVRLVTGSRGTLGLITRAHLRLRAIPEAEVSAVWLAAHPAGLLEKARVAQNAWLSAMELLSPQVSHAVLGEVRWALLVRASGNIQFASEAARRLMALAPDRITAPSADADPAWAALDQAERDRLVAIQVAGPPAALDSMLDAAHEITSPDAGRWRIASHAGNGMVRMWRSEPIDADRADRLSRAIETGRRALHELRAVIDLTDGAETMPAPFVPRVLGEGERRLVDGIRRVFDPAAILSNPCVKAVA
jgi:FAD/FMN-containing dehydrogenase